MDTWTVRLPYRRPPLTLNQRLHHMAEHRIKGELKLATMLVAQSLRIPPLRAITAELVWFKGDNRVADPDNIAPTLKPILDGLKERGVVPDDNANHVFRTSNRIVLRRDDPTPSAGARLEVRIRDMSALAGTP